MSLSQIKPELLRELYGIRFHHFLTLEGRLVATIATEPYGTLGDLTTTDTYDEALVDEDPFAVALDGFVAKGCLADTEIVGVACAVCAKEDAPTRKRGRGIALGRLETGQVSVMTMPELKQRITDRSIVADFITDKIAFKLGYGGDFHPKTGVREVAGSVGRLVSDLRPRKEFER
jgi:hypothetical protein